MKPSVLIVDDEKSIRFTFEHFLVKEGYDVTVADTYNKAMEEISKKEFDVIFTDVFLDDKTGIDILRMAKEKWSATSVVIITGYPAIDTVSEALRLGAFDYMAKPVQQKNLLHTAVMALKHKELLSEKERFRSNLEAIFRSVEDGIITVDKELNIIAINDSAGKFLSSSDFDFKARPFTSFASVCECEKLIHGLNMTISEKVHILLNRIEYAGMVVTVRITPLIKGHDEFSGAVMVIRDETHMVEMENKLQERSGFHNIIGKSEKMQKIYNLLKKLATVPSTVLITGESGTGKELIVDALHHKGNRKDKPLVKINCSALSETLLESELFGHVKGAFTGSVKDKDGLFKKADSGTIFLDEIGDISPALQLRLLRVLQEKEFMRVGDSRAIKVDVRVISATNQNLEDKVKSGKFREDLYYRLKVFEINLPPLRERKEDILLLTEHFINKFRKSFNKNIQLVSSDVKNLFLEYGWPGNIRELEHAVEHAFILCNQDVITREDLPDSLNMELHKGHNGDSDMEITPNLLMEALEKNGWKKAKAARFLGISRNTIYRKIDEYNIKRI